MNLRNFLARILRRNGKTDFLSRQKHNVFILDVGCGNNSPFQVKRILPKCNYIGLDIGDYNQTKPLLADKYILTTPNEFHTEIEKFNEYFDVVISSHNIEHCNDRDAVLMAMMKSIKKGGQIFMAFPCEESVNFPRRGGTLNYFDDDTHLYSPPNFRDIIRSLNTNGFSIIFSQKNYSPIILRIYGFIVEPISKIRNKVMRGTWEYYGFESIIIAKKN